MITPLDIQNKEFAKSVRGYKEEDVDGFLDLLTLDMEKLIEENRKLKDQIQKLNDEILQYKSSQGTVTETLDSVKALMNDIASSADRRAEAILKSAELDAQMITKEARVSVSRLTEERDALQNRYIQFRNRFKSMLEAELQQLDEMSEELLPGETVAETGTVTSETINDKGSEETDVSDLEQFLQEISLEEDPARKEANGER